jgi:hypothetical protein
MWPVEDAQGPDLEPGPAPVELIDPAPWAWTFKRQPSPPESFRTRYARDIDIKTADRLGVEQGLAPKLSF